MKLEIKFVTEVYRHHRIVILDMDNNPTFIEDNDKLNLLFPKQFNIKEGN